MSDIIRIGVALSKESHKRFVAAAKQFGMSQGALVEALTAALEDPEFAGVVQKVRAKIEETRRLKDELMRKIEKDPELARKLLAEAK